MTLNEIASRAGVRWRPGLVRDAEGDLEWRDRAIYDTSDMDLQLYTKLVVEECIKAGSTAFYKDNSTIPVFPTQAILEHFGMK